MASKKKPSPLAHPNLGLATSTVVFTLRFGVPVAPFDTSPVEDEERAKEMQDAADRLAIAAMGHRASAVMKRQHMRWGIAPESWSKPKKSRRT